MPDDTKKDRKAILKAITTSITKSPKSMYELSKELGSNWDTIKSNVKILEELGLIIVKEGKVIYIPNDFRITRFDTMGGIPVSTEVKNKIFTLAKKFLKAWNEVTDKPLYNVALQKAIVQIADSFPELKLPRGWYRYGKVVLVKLSKEKVEKSSADYDFKLLISDIKKLEEKIKKIALDFSKLSIAKIVENQYNEYNQQFYMIRKNIENYLGCNNFVDNKDNLAKNFYEFVFAFKLDQSDEMNVMTYHLLKDSITIMLKRLYDKTIKDDVIQKELVIVFDYLWNLISTYYLYKTLEGDVGYDPVYVMTYCEDKLNSYQNELIEKFQEIGLV